MTVRDSSPGQLPSGQSVIGGISVKTVKLFRDKLNGAIRRGFNMIKSM